MFTARMIEEMLNGIGETLYMTLFSTLLAYVLGMPIGVALYVTDKNGLKPCKGVNAVLGTIVNIVRSVPFIILLITILPFTQWLLGTTLGATATVVPLVICAAPFIGRMVESSLKEVPAGVIEASRAMGTSNMKIILKTLIPEAKPSLISGCTITVTTILGYTAMAGYVGGGGLGAIAINYGYYRYNTPVMLVTVLLMVIIVQLFQEIGSRIEKKTDKRIR
ncbi:MAG: ABC transporter permease [Clostridia bacterium]|nr:ABC transporter permease [Clostridia bacterium]